MEKESECELEEDRVGKIIGLFVGSTDIVIFPGLFTLLSKENGNGPGPTFNATLPYISIYIFIHGYII